LRDLRRATELDAGLARAWYTLSEALAAAGAPAESRLAAQKALAADIYAADAPSVLRNLMFSALERSGRGESDSLCTMGRRFYPEDPNFLECRLTILGWLGAGGNAVSQAWAEVRQLDTIPAMIQGRLARRLLVAAILARGGALDSARGVLTTTRSLAHDERSWRELGLYEAYIRVLLGERGRAIQILRGIAAEAPDNRAWLSTHPWFHALRDDPEFQSLVGAN
jgi:hypothetical protein